MQSLAGFKRRYEGLSPRAFAKKFPCPLLLVRQPKTGGGTSLWVYPVKNRPDEGHFAEEVSIGRARDNDLVLQLDSVSKHHAHITQDEDRYQLTDLNSKNGTSVNGLPLAPYAAATIRSGEVVGVGTEVQAVFLSSEDFFTKVVHRTDDPFEDHGTE